MPKNVLLAHISDVSGHKAAADAVERALKIIEPSTSVLSTNLFNYTNPYSERIVNRLYLAIIKRIPQIWEHLYDNPKIIKSTKYAKNLIHKFNAKKIKKLFDEFKPDVIACTQAFPCGMFADFKKIYRLNTPLIAIVTDFLPHSYWLYQNVDYYSVANEESKNRLIELGVEDKKIKLLGIPINPKFSIPLDKVEIAQRLGLDVTLPVILVMGGGQGLGPIKSIVRELDSLNINSQLIIVTGTNLKLCGELKKMRFNKKCILLGYVDNIDELMEVSSIIVTKPGGLTISEALAKAVIPVIVNPIPGQEENNTKYLLKHNSAFRAKNAEDVGAIVENLISHREKYAIIQQNLKYIAKPKSAFDIASLILQNA